MISPTIRTVTQSSQGEYREKGSRFIGLLYPVSTESETKVLIAKARKDHPKAAHHCYAFRIGTTTELFRYSDDREPSGSAGRPIFGVIQQQELSNVLIIVVRYFGGTQLGIPGLIQAYRESALSAINNGKVVEQKIIQVWTVSYPRDLAEQVIKLIKRNGGVIRDHESAASERLICELGVIESNRVLQTFTAEYPFIERVQMNAI